MEAIVHENTSTFFAKVLGFSSMNPRARAVAGSSPGTACMIMLAPSGRGIDISNSATIDAPNCGVLVNSSSTDAIFTKNSAKITSPSVGTSGEWDQNNSSSIVPNGVVPHIPPTSDPLATRTPPSAAGSCITNGAAGTPYDLNSGAATIGPGTYCGFTLGHDAELTLLGGEYVVTGTITLNQGAKIFGTSGVLLYKTGGIISVSQHSEIWLTAKTTGPWAGIAYWQAHNSDINLNQSVDLHISGILYAPSALIRIRNSATIGGTCTVIVAFRLDSDNSSNMDNNCSMFGGNPLKTISLAE